MVMLARPLHSKHILQNTQEFVERNVRHAPQALDKAFSINSPHLISHDVAVLPLESAAHTKWVWMAICWEWRHNECPEVIHLPAAPGPERPCQAPMQPLSGLTDGLTRPLAALASAGLDRGSLQGAADAAGASIAAEMGRPVDSIDAPDIQGWRTSGCSYRRSPLNF